MASALAAAALVSAATRPSCAESACQPLMATAPVFTHMLQGLMKPPSTRAWTRATAVGARAMREWVGTAAAKTPALSPP